MTQNIDVDTSTQSRSLCLSRPHCALPSPNCSCFFFFSWPKSQTRAQDTIIAQFAPPFFHTQIRRWTSSSCFAAGRGLPWPRALSLVRHARSPPSLHPRAATIASLRISGKKRLSKIPLNFTFTPLSGLAGVTTACLAVARPTRGSAFFVVAAWKDGTHSSVPILSGAPDEDAVYVCIYFEGALTG